MAVTDPLPTKGLNLVQEGTVDIAFSWWVSPLAQEEPETTHEGEARFLAHVTAKPSLQKVITALAIEKRADNDEERRFGQLTMEEHRRNAGWGGDTLSIPRRSAKLGAGGYRCAGCRQEGE